MSSENTNKNHKKLLNDPLAYYLGHVAERDKTVIAKIEQKTGLYTNLKSEKKVLNEKSQKLSRLIGQAKKNQLPANELIRQMQEISKEIKNLDQDLSQTETLLIETILPSSKETGSNEDTTDKYDWQRRYKGTSASINDITISTFQKEIAPGWDNFVQKNDNTSLYHLSKWRTLIEKSFGHQSFYLCANDRNNNIVGILPLIRLKSKLFGDFLVSVPFFNYGGAVADTVEIEDRLIDHVNQLAIELGVQHVEYRDDLARQNLPAKTDKVNMMLALPDDPNILWNKFSPKLRSQIRRPERENPEVCIGHLELLNDFYRVFSINMRDLGTPVYHKSFFKNILSIFPDNSHILIIKHNGKPVAAAFLLGYKNTLEIPWASTLRKVNHLSMNMLMYWEILKFAIKNNYKYFDFGRSSRDSGTYRFKQQWGAVERPMFWHYWLPTGTEMPALNPSNPKYALVIAIWRRLPVFVTKLIGPLIVKNLP